MPVKSFREAKVRLSGTLDDHARQRLARDLAAIVIRAQTTCPAFVACDDDEVADWAITEGATVLWTPGLGLSGAVLAGFRYLGTQGFSLVTVVHADLPLAIDLSRFGAMDSVTIAPDHRLDGTNVISVPTSTMFTFAYGPRSYHAHRAEAAARGLTCRSVFDWRLAADVDLPEDLAHVSALLESGTSQ